MSDDLGKSVWPPDDGHSFIRSEEFASHLLRLVERMVVKYPSMDFSDGVAHVFAWFDAKLSQDKDFINNERFKTNSRFWSYTRQAVWNSALHAQRQRRQRKRLEPLRVEELQNWKDSHMGPMNEALFEERVEQLSNQLPGDLKEIFLRVVLEDDLLENEGELAVLLSRLGLGDAEELGAKFEEALDIIKPTITDLTGRRRTHRKTS